MDEETRQIVRELRDLVRKCKELDAEYQAMSPEERAEVNRLLEEHLPEFEFLSEIVHRLRAGSMTPEEANRWTNEIGRLSDGLAGLLWLV